VKGDIPMKYWTEEETLILKEHYGKIKVKNLQQLLPNRTLPSIRWQAQQLKLKADRTVTNKHTNFDESFFSNINIINSYWAGFIAADGCIYQNKCVLYQNDINVIQNFQIAIHHNGNISHRYRIGCGHEYSISLSSQKIVDDLNKNFSITPNKSLTLKPPNIDNVFALAYIIGYVDGDGYICIINSKNRKPYFVLGIIGTYDLLYWIKKILNLESSPHLRTDCKSPIYRLTATHNTAINLVNKLKSIKELDNIRLERKWNKINEFESAVRL
jgi:hypothetical protein